jgi:hypothetical protein
MHYSQTIGNRQHREPEGDNGYLPRIKRTLFPLSHERNDFRKAISEWDYTGKYRSNDDCCAGCGLCGHPGLRYEFEIRNRCTGATLFVGSECIKKFQIRATDYERRKLSAIETQHKVADDRRQLQKVARDRYVVSKLLEATKADNEFDLEDFLTYWTEHGAFTPNQLSFLFWRLGESAIPYECASFKVKIRRSRERDQLSSMPGWKLEKIWPALSPSQRRWCSRNRRDSIGNGGSDV